MMSIRIQINFIQYIVFFSCLITKQIVYCCAEVMKMNDEITFARKILQLSNRIQAVRNEDLKGLDLTGEQADTLRFFNEHKDATASDLKDQFGVSHQAARALVERLKNKGFLKLSVSEKDGRARTVSLTEKGYDVLARMDRYVHASGSKLIKRMSEEEVRTFLTLVTTAIDNMEPVE